jgi:hypothetical protein
MKPIYTEEITLPPGAKTMKSSSKLRLRALLLRFWPLFAILFCAGQPGAQADSTSVRHVEGTIHGFLELRSEDGQVVASGDSIQLVHGGRVTSQTVFKFNDGSIDDETTVFSQRGVFKLITYHRVQKGPAFPHPMDVTIDAGSGQVTVRTTGKDGKEEVQTDHVKLPPDLANGLVPVVVENMPADAQTATVSMLLSTPKPRLVKLTLTKLGEDDFSLGGLRRKANHYQIKIELGGVAGIVAPIIGKEPPTIDMWAVGGQAPAFVKEHGPLYPDGPMMTIQLASPVWTKSQSTAN